MALSHLELSHKPVVVAIVVTLKVSDIPPMVSVALFVVEYAAGDILRTLTVLPRLTVELALV